MSHLFNGSQYQLLDLILSKGMVNVKRKVVSLALILSIVLMLVARLYIDNNVVQITENEIVSSEIPEAFEGYTILQISDLHNRSFGANNSQLIRKIDKVGPDIIVITGDMVTGNDTDFTVFFELIENISDRYEIIFVPGNHEVALKNEDKEKFLDLFDENDVVFLDNENIELSIDGETISLYGLWYEIPYYKRQDLTAEMIQERIGDVDSSKYTILLTHHPKYFELYEGWGADLILTGHVHGGMVRLPMIGGIFSPDTFWFPQYSAGQYTIHDSTMIVSRGLGIGTRGFRLFNRPELVVITLKTA